METIKWSDIEEDSKKWNMTLHEYFASSEETLFRKLLKEILSLQFLNVTLPTPLSDADESTDFLTHSATTSNSGDPGLYILVVLLFYSCGIILLMVNYIKRDTSDSGDYYIGRYLEPCTPITMHHDDRTMDNNSRGRALCKSALTTVNVANVIQTDEKVNYV